MKNIKNVLVTDALENTYAFAPTGGSSGDIAVSVTAKVESGCTVYYVDGVCPAGFSGDTGITLHFFDEPTDGFVAIENHSPFWCRPFFGNDLKALPERTQMVLIHTLCGKYRVILPVCDSVFKTVLQGNDDGFVAIVASNDCKTTRCEHQLALITSEGEDPYAVIRNCTTLAAKFLGNGLKMRDEKEMPEMLEYIGWCSWDALQYRISHEGLLEKAREFKEKNVPIHFAILDDMWADIPDFKNIPEEHTFRELVDIMHQSRIRTFDGDPLRFPKGMAAAIEDLKKTGIPSVGLWYPTTGYWKGFDVESDLVRAYPECFVGTKGGKWHRNGNDTVTVVKPEQKAADQFFDVIAKRAKEWGIDFIKVDNQGYHLHYKDLYPIGESARVIQRAIDRSADTNFDGAMINCMGMPSECMFNRPTSAVSRCSDDFIPESREWFTKNILQCAYNGLLQGQYYINDWDMFWTDDEQAVKNSICRAISGGPIYVSDKIGRTRPEILEPLCLADGRILRPDHSAIPTRDCLTVDPSHSGRPMKIYNRVGAAALIAVFHIDVEHEAVQGSVSPLDAELAAENYVYFEYFTGACGVVSAGEAIELTLPDHDTFRLYTFIPISGDVTCLGRLDKYVGVGAVLSVDQTGVTLAEGGKVGFYTEHSIRVFSHRRELLVTCENGVHSVACDADETELRYEILE